MINNNIYQQIFDELKKYLLPEWDRLVVYLEYGEASFSFSFYVKVNNEYVKCYDLPGVSDNNIARSPATNSSLPGCSVRVVIKDKSFFNSSLFCPIRLMSLGQN